MREHPKFAGVITLLVLPALMLAASGRRVYAQGATPERGFQPGGSYAASDIETVSTTSGNMMLHFPLGKLPAGRGGLSALLSLNYDSKIYDSYVHHEADPYAAPNPNPPPGSTGEVIVERNLLRQSDGGGWHYTYGYNLQVVDRDDQYDFGYQPQYPDWSAISRWKVRVTFPDGSPHEFTLRGFNDEDRMHDGYSDVRPDGYRSWWYSGSCWPNSCVVVQDSPFYYGTLTYYSTDGTYARLEIQHDSDGIATNNPWTLYLPDGTRVTNGGTRIYDRNNNYIDLGFTQLANGHYAEVLTDQLGRSVTLEYSAAPNEDDIRVKGVGGEDMVYRIKWKTIQVNKTYPTCMGGVVVDGAVTLPLAGICEPRAHGSPVRRRLVRGVPREGAGLRGAGRRGRRACRRRGDPPTSTGSPVAATASGWRGRTRSTTRRWRRRRRAVAVVLTGWSVITAARRAWWSIRRGA